jgi:hypothetical protein
VLVGEDGTFTMTTGKISENTASDDGGGVHVNENGIFIMHNGEISENEASDSGGGVFIWAGTFAMNDGEISGNEASTGGGVWVNGDGNFTMENGKILQNTAAENGGGVWVGGSGTFTMGDGEISGNGAFAGGGVWIGDGTASMHGGEISGNQGEGVFVTYDGAFIMSDRARVSDSVCLHHNGNGNSSITIGGNFTGSDLVATIDLYSDTDPATSWPGEQLLKRAAGFTGNLPTDRFTLGYFISIVNSVPDFTSITGYSIGADGKLIH